MDSDPNLFAVLVPCDEKNFASDAFGLPENAHCYHKAAEGIVVIEPTMSSREPTPAPQIGPALQSSSDVRILLRLDKSPKKPKVGWQFGTDPQTCDVLLGHRGTRGISSRHFRIAITEQLRVELHDNSRYGTVVHYDGQLRKVLDKQLLFFEPGVQTPWNAIMVSVPDEDGLVFKIGFPSHPIGGSEYLENIRAHLEQCKSAPPFLGGLGLTSNPNTSPFIRKPQTCHKLNRYYVKKEIGRGQFGVVRLLIDIRTGETRAGKRFLGCQAQGDKKKRKRETDFVIERRGYCNGVDLRLFGSGA